MNTPTELLLSALPEARRSGDSWSARCPAHEDRTASLSVSVGDDGRALLHCHAGCAPEAIVGALNLKLSDLMPSTNGHATHNGHASNGKPKRDKKTYATATDAIAALTAKRGRTSATWQYDDATGQHVGTICRWDTLEGKDILPISRNGDGWQSVGMVEPRPLYRLPTLAAAEVVFVCEGEKAADAARSIGLPATTSAHGAKSPAKTDWTPLAGKSVVILPDADEAGCQYAEQVAGILAKLDPPAKVKIVALPGLPPGGDIHEWINDLHGEACEPEEFCRQIDALIEAAPVWQPSPKKTKRKTPRPKLSIAGPDSAGIVPTIDADEKDLATITPQAVAALSASNNPPTLFRHGGLPARIETGDTGEPIVRPLDFHRMRHELSRRARWQSITTRGETETAKLIAPPKDCVNDVLATPNIGLPVLNRIVEAPVFAPDGSLQTAAGYHSASGVFYSPADGFTIPDVSANPTAAEIAEARELICGELLGDFPFVGQSERAHAVGLFILPAARDLIDGPTPLHLIEKPTPGSGATLLVDVITFWAVGRPIGAMTEGRDEDEWRKRITARLRSGGAFGALDNLRRRLDSAAFSSMLTCCWWEDRILGFSEMARLPNRMIWVATGNNPALSNEITRRTIRIRLDPKQDRPWLRTGFRHADLRGWVTENRGRLTWAALTCVSTWLAAGRPAGKKSLGMFEAWAKTIGGILDVVGVSGFLANLESFYDESDAESLAWRGLLLAWREQFGDREVLAKELFPLAVDAGIELGTGNEQSQRIVLGKRLADRRDRIFDVQADGESRQLRIARGDTYRRAAQWKCECVSVDKAHSHPHSHANESAIAEENGECVSVVSVFPPPRTYTHARTHAPAREDLVGNTHTDSHTHTDEPDEPETTYDPWT